MKKRTMITLCPEWEQELERLQKERFCNKTQEEIVQYLISLGLAVSKTKSTSQTTQQNVSENRFR